MMSDAFLSYIAYIVMLSWCAMYGNNASIISCSLKGVILKTHGREWSCHTNIYVNKTDMRSPCQTCQSLDYFAVTVCIQMGFED